MIIDGHAHAAGVFFEKDTLASELDRLGVDKVVLVPMGFSNDDTYSQGNLEKAFREDESGSWIKKIAYFFGNFSDLMYDKPNEYLFTLKQQCPDRIIQYYWANPNDPNIMKDLQDHLPLWNYSGVKLHQLFANFETNQEIVHQIAQFCGSHDMPFFIHMHYKKHIRQFIKLLKANRHTKFIVAHMIGYEIIAEKALGFDNFFFDISPHYMVPDEKILKAIVQFGAGRLMLGSDTPLGNNNLEKSLGRVRALRIPESDKEKILGLNLKVLLKL
jgi:predicted TIM-barrel fold metal-dependent hydrolase